MQKDIRTYGHNKNYTNAIEIGLTGSNDKVPKKEEVERIHLPVAEVEGVELSVGEEVEG